MEEKRDNKKNSPAHIVAAIITTMSAEIITINFRSNMQPGLTRSVACCKPLQEETELCCKNQE